jgi:hypothetical protein
MGSSVDAHHILKGFIDRTDRVLQLLEGFVQHPPGSPTPGLSGTPHQMCVRCSISARYSVSVNIVVTTSEDAQIGRTGP